jgi:hypothetical protein
MQTKVLISAKQRIRDTLLSRPTDKLGIFDLDIEITDKNAKKESDRFLLFGFNGPFQQLSFDVGLEEALRMFESEPHRLCFLFKKRQEMILGRYQALKARGIAFDGAWMWEDIAYDKRLYFSLEKYRNRLMGIHRDICSFFISEGLAPLFHCDGNVEALIPFLAAMGIKAIHPMQEASNPHLLTIKKVYKQELTFIGGVGLHRLQAPLDNILRRVAELSEGDNYIFSFDGPLPRGFDMKKYNEIIDSIRSLKRINYVNRDTK